jgi:radical SAM protein with 4Fe4S-binding SPASM domain
MHTITDKIDAITLIDDAHRVPAPPCPRSVKIELTARCNFNCSFCATGYNLRSKRDMDRNFYSRLLADLREAGVEEVGMFYLGESFLLDWLPDAVAEAKDLGIPYVFLTTNGASATPDKVQDCMEAGLDSLKFSLNYADKEQFREVAGVKGALFDRMIENLKEARQIRDEGGHDCGLFASYIQYDGVQGQRMEALLGELAPYLDEVYALPLYSQADLTSQDSAEHGWAIRAGNPGRVGSMRDPIPCWSLFTEARVTYDGYMSACCFNHDGRFHMGDLHNTTFMDAWRSPKFRDLREAHLKRDVRDTACERCAAFE